MPVGNVQAQFLSNNMTCPEFSAKMLEATLLTTPPIVEEDSLLTVAVLKGMFRLGCIVEKKK